MTRKAAAASRRGAGESLPELYDPNCARCPRLASYLASSRTRYPDYWSRPVAAFGDSDPRILIVGLAPGLHGANRSGRPFTGDYAGILLYETLHSLGLASQPTGVAADDGLKLISARITNAVKCAPPDNKPNPDEIRRCNAFLKAEIARLSSVRVFVALGRIAHDAVLMALELKRSEFVFAHGQEHDLGPSAAGGRYLIDSYHCSRYNTQTRRLTPEMFKSVLSRACVLARVK
jgi:uracil-DNA glycosylase family 4